MDSLANPAARRGFGATSRIDAWWLKPTLVFLGLGGFVVYSTWAALQNAHFELGNYLSPMYSPVLLGNSHHSWFGPEPTWWPALIPFSPAILILWGPVGFRITCYYYRGAYYKAFWADPPACAVSEPRKSYWGESSFPLLIQNVHRFFLYIAVLFLVVLSHDAWKAMWFVDPATGETGFGIGVGTLVITANVVFLSLYTFGCHSMRHLVGGFVNQFSKAPARKKAYDCVSCLNRAHMNWAWTSLVWVAFTDLYIRLCSVGVWTDFRLL
jgi:hypothetical protein